MKNYFKYSMLITLVILITTSLVTVQAPAIGTTTQPHPYESNPTAIANFMVGAPLSTGKDAMKDGDLTSSGDFFLGAPHILRPDGNSLVNTAWLESPAGLGYYVWKEESANGNTDYAYTSTTSAKETSTLEDPPADAGGTISSVTVYAVAERTSTGTTTAIKLMLRLGGVETFSAVITFAAINTYYLKSAAVSRPGGGSWSWGDITSLEAGVQMGTVAGTVRVTQLYIEVAGPTTGYFELKTFTNTPTTSFSIGFVDIKIKYNVPTALNDDKYNITYTTGTTWNTLQANTGDAYDRDTTPAIRPWSQVAKPGGGSWDWPDIGNLRIRVGVTATGAWDNLKMYIFEVWLSIYPLPLPPSGGTPSAHLAVIPSAIYKVGASDYIFVDIYVTGVSAMGGIDFTMLFDTSILTATEAWIYDPFHYVANAPITLDNTNGWVIFSQYMKTGEAVGFTGSEPIARIYFTVNQWGMSKLNIQNATESGPKATAMYTVTGPSIPYVDHDGWVSSPRYLSAVDTGDYPITVDISWPTVNNTKWRELYPTYSKKWTLTSLHGNGDGVLSPSDQIDMLNETNYRYWFHVDVVTITIHWSNTSTLMQGIAEPSSPAATLPTDPSGTSWTEIYSTFNRPMAIDNYTDINTNTVFDIGDRFGATYTDTTTSFYARLDAVSTDILVSMKPIPPVYVQPPPVPEFPLGIEALMALAPLIPIIYRWRKRPKKSVTQL